MKRFRIPRASRTLSRANRNMMFLLRLRMRLEAKRLGGVVITYGRRGFL